ncbi:MAG TPA: hypothetical protein VHM30_14485 [Gemmatimonadaceae bacterium]|nr:hypothetical protein [Gemmatimonadaceae bacterium]
MSQWLCSQGLTPFEGEERVARCVLETPDTTYFVYRRSKTDTLLVGREMLVPPEEVSVATARLVDRIAKVAGQPQYCPSEKHYEEVQVVLWPERGIVIFATQANLGGAGSFVALEVQARRPECDSYVGPPGGPL